MVDSKLLKKIASGDQQAFRELFDLYHGKLFELARYYSKSDQVAEEVTNDVFIKIWKKRNKLSAIKQLDSYLYIATKNETLTYLRDNKKDLALMSINQVELNLKLQVQDAEHSFLSKELLKELEDSIKNLPEKSGLVYRMVKEDNLSYKEVARVLDLSVKSVEKHMGLAFKRIRKDLSSYLSCSDLDYKNVIISLLTILSFTFF
ncbi:MAG: RNA polymerase sigma-70 factor [Cyclobacteriaceae bacterium]|nr:RNA polymerase sigma-70 factor [Cyclobacteriaceae bacterium SS2]